MILVRIWNDLALFYIEFEQNNALRVPRAVTRLTVDRRLQYEILAEGRPWADRQIRKFEECFSKNLSFSCISMHFWDFLCLKYVIAKPYARGFAPL